MKVLIVGCGSIGRRRAALAASLAETAVIDALPEAARRAAEACDARWFRTLDDGLAWSPDGVVVATPNDTHLEVATRAVTGGAHVLIEKPISHGEAGVEDFLGLAERLGRHVHVVCNMRYHPGPATLQSYLSATGRPYYARAYYGHYLPNMRPGVDYRTLYAARRDSGGGVLLDAIHEIDYLVWMFGPVDEVACQAGRLGQLEIDVEDYAQVNLKHRSGVRSEIHLDFLRPRKGRGCEVVGSEGVLVWESDGRQPEICRVRLCRSGSRDWKSIVESDHVDGDAAQRRVMELFIAALAGDAVPLLDGRTAADELRVVLAAHRAAETRESQVPTYRKRRPPGNHENAIP